MCIKIFILFCTSLSHLSAQYSLNSNKFIQQRDDFNLFLFAAASDLSHGVSTKMDFGEEEEAPTVVVTNSSQLGDDDVEVKHTIVVSTKLKNNNRRGVTSNNGKSRLNPVGSVVQMFRGNVINSLHLGL